MAVPRELVQAWAPLSRGEGVPRSERQQGPLRPREPATQAPDVAANRTRAAEHLAVVSELVRSAVLAVEELRSAGVPTASLNELNEVGYALHRAGVALDNLVQAHGTHRHPDLQA